MYVWKKNPWPFPLHKEVKLPVSYTAMVYEKALKKENSHNKCSSTVQFIIVPQKRSLELTPALSLVKSEQYIIVYIEV